jgi:hypothetical protein
MIKKTKSCVTIERLHKLRRGEVMTVYRGNFELDLAQSDAPKYKALLGRVHECMLRLEREGRIMVSVEPASILIPSDKPNKPDKVITFKRYIATGIKEVPPTENPL